MQSEIKFHSAGRASSMREIRMLAFLAALLFVSMATYTSSVKPSIPELQLTFSHAAYQHITGMWSVAEMDRFRMHFLIDFPFLLSYGALGYRMAGSPTIFRALSVANRARLALALPVAAMADCVENVFHLLFISADEPLPEFAYFMAGMTASLKWLLITAFVAAFIAALLRNRRVTGPTNSP